MHQSAESERDREREPRGTQTGQVGEREQLCPSVRKKRRRRIRLNKDKKHGVPPSPLPSRLLSAPLSSTLSLPPSLPSSFPELPPFCPSLLSCHEPINNMARKCGKEKKKKKKKKHTAVTRAYGGASRSMGNHTKPTNQPLTRPTPLP